MDFLNSRQYSARMFGKARSATFSLKILVVAGAASFGPACAKKPSSSKPAEDAVAVVGGVAIERAALDHQLRRLPAGVRASYDSQEGRKQLLDTMVRSELLLREAERRGFDKDPEYQRLIKQQLVDHLLSKVIDGAGSSKGVTDADVEGHYRTHQAELVRSEQVRVAQILVKDRQLAMRLLKQVRTLPRAGAEAFTALARRHAIDEGSRASGGDLGLIDRDTTPLSPVLIAGAYALKQPGDISEVLETERGYHILRLTARQPSAPRPFGEVKEQIRQRLTQESRLRRTDQLVNEARARFRVEIFEARLKAAGAPSKAVVAEGK
jgi:peptidyl-prolyl cis-trans isomerase C